MIGLAVMSALSVIHLCFEIQGIMVPLKTEKQTESYPHVQYVSFLFPPHYAADSGE